MFEIAFNRVNNELAACICLADRLTGLKLR